MAGIRSPPAQGVLTTMPAPGPLAARYRAGCVFQPVNPTDRVMFWGDPQRIDPGVGSQRPASSAEHAAAEPAQAACRLCVDRFVRGGIIQPA